MVKEINTVGQNDPPKKPPKVKSRGRGKLERDARLVLFLKSEGLNSTQVRYICKKKLGLKHKNIDNKIHQYIKRPEQDQADKIYKNNHILEKLKINGLINRK